MKGRTMDLDRKTLKWCTKQIRKLARQCGAWSGPRNGWASTVVASPNECLGRAILLRDLADQIKNGKRS